MAEAVGVDVRGIVSTDDLAAAGELEEQDGCDMADGQSKVWSCSTYFVLVLLFLLKII